MLLRNTENGNFVDLQFHLYFNVRFHCYIPVDHRTPTDAFNLFSFHALAPAAHLMPLSVCIALGPRSTGRVIVAFRHNLAYHLGKKSVVGNSGDRFIPSCYELLYDWLQVS